MTVRISINDKSIEREFPSQHRARPWIELMAKQWASQPYFVTRMRINKLNEKLEHWRKPCRNETIRIRIEIARLEEQLKGMTDPGKMSVEIIATVLQK